MGYRPNYVFYFFEILLLIMQIKKMSKVFILSILFLLSLTLYAKTEQKKSSQCSDKSRKTISAFEKALSTNRGK